MEKTTDPEKLHRIRQLLTGAGYTHKDPAVQQIQVDLEAAVRARSRRGRA